MSSVLARSVLEESHRIDASGGAAGCRDMLFFLKHLSRNNLQKFFANGPAGSPRPSRHPSDPDSPRRLRGHRQRAAKTRFTVSSRIHPGIGGERAAETATHKRRWDKSRGTPLLLAKSGATILQTTTPTMHRLLAARVGVSGCECRRSHNRSIRPRQPRRGGDPSRCRCF